MPIFDLFSKRKKRASQQGQPEVFSYDSIPAPFRVRVVHILRDAIGVIINHGYCETQSDLWQFIHATMTREKGVFSLGRGYQLDEECCNWFVQQADTDEALDFIELTFRVIEKVLGQKSEYDLKQMGIKQNANNAIKELNGRLREEGLGYQYENGEIIRVDNQFVHAEIVKPALLFLSGESFEKANEDFMTAHEYYRHGKHKDSVVAAQRALESMLKAICTIKKWQFQPSDRVSELIKIVRAKGLFPDYLGNGFDSYIAMLKTGLPDIRNNAGGHGEGPSAPPVPAYIASLALHMTATYIVLLGEALKNIK